MIVSCTNPCQLNQPTSGAGTDKRGSQHLGNGTATNVETLVGPVCLPSTITNHQASCGIWKRLQDKSLIYASEARKSQVTHVLKYHSLQLTPSSPHHGEYSRRATPVASHRRQVPKVYSL